MRMSLTEPLPANHKPWPCAFAPLLSCPQQMESVYVLPNYTP